MFDVEQFKKVLQTRWLGHDFLYAEELESTNSYAKKAPEEEISHGTVCLADHQTRGRGQYERNWQSLPEQNLTFTIVLMPRRSERLHILTLACARAAVELIEKQTALRAHIKWPNDIMINGGKVAGLLTETVFCGNTLDRVVVGIGLNVNQEMFDDHIRRTATSLKIEEGHSFCREKLLAGYLGIAEHCYTRWHKNDPALLKSINQKIIGYGNWITLSVNGDSRPDKYKLVGVNEKGHLTVINKESEVETFSHEQIRLITD